MVKVQKHVSKEVKKEDQARKFIAAVDSDVTVHWSKCDPTEKTSKMMTLKLNAYHQGMLGEIQRMTGLSAASIIKSALADKARELDLFE